MTANPTPTAADGRRPAPPTMREITDPTARPRALSTPGWADHPTERAAFLTNQDALLIHTTAGVSPRRDLGPDVVGLVCAECGDDAIEQSAPVAAGRPVYVHPDGEPLCSAPGDHRRAAPVEVVHEPDGEIRAARAAVTRALTGIDPLSADDARREQLTHWHHEAHADRHRDGLHDEAGAL